MIKKNDIIETSVTAWGSKGEGIAKVDGYTLFVPYAVPGDRLKIKVLKAGKSYGYGKIEEIILPSHRRAHPPCPSYKGCGGCSLMHLNYPAQLEFKRQRVEDAMRRIGGFYDAEIADVIPMENAYNYRNKVQMPVGGEAGKPIVGFFAPGSHRIGGTVDCMLQHGTSRDIIRTIMGWMEKFKIPSYDEKTMTGIVRHIYIRTGFKTGEIMVSVVSNSQKLPHERELVEALVNLELEDFYVKSVIHNINRENTNVVLGKRNRVLHGEEFITDELDGIKFKISHNSFYQVNPQMTEKIYKKVADLLGEFKNKTVLDVYCGIGTISLYLARYAKKVIGIEWTPEAVRDAKYNAGQNNLENTEFHAGDAGEVMGRLYGEGVRGDAVVLDPPRKGCDEGLLNTLCEMLPEKIVYVSCNPATMARDLKRLAEAGYKIETVYPFDQFPSTTHVEVTCRLIKVKK